MAATTQEELLTLTYPRDRQRRVRVRIEGPAGYKTAGRALPYVLVVHGFKGFMHWGFFPLLSRRLARLQIVAVSLNVSGCGVGADLQTFDELEAFAANTISRELEDIDLVRHYIRGSRPQGMDVHRAGMYGHSRGGGTALLHAVEHEDYRAFVAWAPVATFALGDEALEAEWRRRGYHEILNSRTGQLLRVDATALLDIEQSRARFDLIAAARRLRAPALFVHGSADTTVPLAAAQQLQAACPRAQLLEIEAAGHTFGALHPLDGIPPELDRALDATTVFFSEQLG